MSLAVTISIKHIDIRQTKLLITTTCTNLKIIKHYSIQIEFYFALKLCWFICLLGMKMLLKQKLFTRIIGFYMCDAHSYTRYRLIAPSFGNPTSTTLFFKNKEWWLDLRRAFYRGKWIFQIDIWLYGKWSASICSKRAFLPLNIGSVKQFYIIRYKNVFKNDFPLKNSNLYEKFDLFFP